ncbi:flavin monoamine oxidase family protein [Sphingobium sp.]|uniref:flavin monoamine oxidase family protein n=1 Tax=Sphingobium sp. TaxID=1912891 RepID=UPI003BB7A598
MQINRRDIIAGATLLGLAASPLGAAVKKAAGPSEPDVIILGAGISGLNAAYLLEQQGAKVLVLEARQRVGGRVLTLMDQPGYPEMGFNSMAAGYGRGIDAAQRAGVELVDVAPRYMVDPRQQLVVGGQSFTREQWTASPLNPLPNALKGMMPWEVLPSLFMKSPHLPDWNEWIRVAPAQDISVQAYLASQGLDDAAIRLVFDTAPYAGTNAYDSAAVNYDFNFGWTKDQMASSQQSFAVKGGNQQLTDAMAKMIKGDLLRGKEVIGIESGPGGATVTCRDGSRYKGGKVLSSLPFSTLRNISLTPALTGAQAQAVMTLPYQPLSIAFLTVREPYWEKDQLPVSMWTDGPMGTVLAQRYGATNEQVTGLSLFARGRLAQYWDRLGKDAVLKLVVEEMARVRPASKGLVTGAAFHSWGLEPFNGGDWAYFAPGQVSSFGQAMAVPAGRLHFCGEHTAVSNRGLEGALESSERAVLEILSA